MKNNNADKLKKGLTSERENLTSKVFSITGDSDDKKFDKAEQYYSTKEYSKERIRLVTSTFKVPEDEFNTVSKTIKILVNNNITNVKQTEVFRMALRALDGLTQENLIKIYHELVKIKTGTKSK